MKKNLPSWSAALTKLLGSKKVSTQSSVCEEHGGDAWFAHHMPEAVVFPESTEDVSKTLAFATKYKIPVTPRGAGRGYVGSCVPLKGGISISLARMNRIKEIHVSDNVAVVQPGVITGDLQKAVKKKGLFYPPDPASLSESSIGGNIATNAGGPRCVKYGVTRNFVLGLEVVLMNGDVLKAGGRTIKNKVGFDLVGLFVGSEGLLGIVTEATLRLLPHPPSRSAVVGTFPTSAKAAAAIAAIQKAGIIPSALEIADPFTMEAARKYVKNAPQGDALVFVEIDGQAASVRGEVRTVAELYKKCGALKVTQAHGDADCEKLWEVRRAFSASLKATGLKKLNEDITVPRGRLLDLFDFTAKLQKKYGYPIACFGHAGDGNIHTNIMVPTEKLERKKEQLEMLDQLFAQVIQWNGAITGEHGIGIAKERWWHQAVTPVSHKVHKQIKKALDPQNLLNPGKFLDS